MISKNTLNIGYVQIKPVFGEIKENVMRAENLIRTVAKPNTLLVLPELFNTGYAFQSKSEAYNLGEPIPGGDTSERLIEIAKRYEIYIVAGLAEIDEGKLYNSAIIVGPAGYIGKYRKNHLFYKEKIWFEPGNLGFPVFNAGKAKIGIIICFDWIFPEAARILALKGADIICHPANLVLPYAQRAMLARSVENRVYTVTANRLGFEKRGGDSFKFTGGSQVTSPSMEVLISGSTDREEARVVEVDLSKARNKSITEKNDIFKDRRPEIYVKLLD